MRIRITTIGSTGDVQPYLALGRGLQQAGHDVALIAAPRYGARIREMGLEFRDSGQAWREDTGDAFLRAFSAERVPLKQLAMFFEWLADSLADTTEHMREATADADLMIVHAPDVFGMAMAERQGIPYITGHLVPFVVRCRNWNPMGTDSGRLVNAALNGLSRLAFRWTADPPLNRLLAQAGLPPRRDLVFEGAQSPLLNLLAVSPHVARPDPSWPGRFRMTGYWFLDEPDFTPPKELANFLAAGEPPVVVTFGSMTFDGVEEVTAALVEGLTAAGCRAIIQEGWAGLGRGPLPPNILRVGFVPHGWLFSRAACVVHHGGAGTTAATLRAGVPSVIVWCLADQPSWGYTTKRLGVGTGSVPRWKLDARWLRRAVEKALKDARVRDNARALGEQIRQEDGVARAVALIEEVGRSAKRRSA